MGERMKLEEIEAMLAAATPGPWTCEQNGKRGAWIGNSATWAALSCGDTDEEATHNARLIAAAPTIIKALVERVRIAKKALEEIKTGEVEVWDDGEEQIIITNMDEEEMQKIAADALDDLDAKEST